MNLNDLFCLLFKLQKPKPQVLNVIQILMELFLIPVDFFYESV